MEKSKASEWLKKSFDRCDRRVESCSAEIKKAWVFSSAAVVTHNSFGGGIAFSNEYLSGARHKPRVGFHAGIQERGTKRGLLGGFSIGHYWNLGKEGSRWQPHFIPEIGIDYFTKDALPILRFSPLGAMLQVKLKHRLGFEISWRARMDSLSRECFGRGLWFPWDFRGDINRVGKTRTA